MSAITSEALEAMAKEVCAGDQNGMGDCLVECVNGEGTIQVHALCMVCRCRYFATMLEQSLEELAGVDPAEHLSAWRKCKHVNQNSEGECNACGVLVQRDCCTRCNGRMRPCGPPRIGEAKCERCGEVVELVESEGCGECTNGWLHMDDSCGRGPGIERCDACAVFGCDDDAKAAHDKDCGCHDYDEQFEEGV